MLVSEKRLREKFLKYAERLEKTEPDLAKKIQERVDELVAWYMQHQRDMTLEEFRKIIETAKLGSIK